MKLMTGVLHAYSLVLVLGIPVASAQAPVQSQGEISPYYIELLAPKPIKAIDLLGNRLLEKTDKFYSSATSVKITGHIQAAGSLDKEGFEFLFRKPDLVHVTFTRKNGATAIFAAEGDNQGYTETSVFGNVRPIPGAGTLRGGGLCGSKEKISSIGYAMVGGRPCDVVEIADYEFQRVVRRLYIGAGGEMWRVESLGADGAVTTYEATSISRDVDLPRQAFAFPEKANQFKVPPRALDNRFFNFKPLPVGASAPDFTLPNPKTGGETSLDDMLKGKDLLILHVWCFHCTGGRDVPLMDKLYADIRNTKVGFGMVEIKEPIAHLADFIDRQAIEYPILATEGRRPVYQQYSAQEGQSLHTTTFLIDRNKKIVGTYRGYMHFYYADMLKAIKEYR